MNKPQTRRLRAIEGNPEASQVVKQELNLEQWALWKPSHATRRKKTLEPRILIREEFQPDGAKLTKSVEIAHTYKGTLTTKDQKVLLALVKIWEDAGRPLTFVFLSRYRLCQILGLKWGTSANTSLEESLDRLAGVTLTFKQSFTDASGETEEKLSFHILNELKLVTRRGKDKDGKTVIKSEKGYFEFHHRIIGNIIRNYSKPVLLDVVLSIENDIAQLLYSHADRILSNTTRYEWRTENIIKDLALEGDEYRYQSRRKRILERAIEELNGKQLSSGGLLKVTIAEAKDKTKAPDYKLIFEKRARITTAPTTGAETYQSDAEKLVSYFHQVFFKADNVKPNRKEIVHAQELLNLHGFEVAKAVIETAKREAPKTGFEIATFGGVMQYQTKATATAKAMKASEARQQAIEEEQRRQRARDNYDQFFEPAFRAYQKTELDRLEQENAEVFKLFKTWFEERHTKALRFVDSETRREEIRLKRAFEFFTDIRPELGIRLISFDDWDENHNAERCDPMENDDRFFNALMERVGLNR